MANEEGARSFTVPDEARVTLDRKRSKLADLKAGLEVLVDMRGRTVIAVAARRQSKVAKKE